MATPLKKYQQDLASKVIVADPHQAQAIQTLEEIYQQLSKPVKKRSTWFGSKKPALIKGAYFYGPVGTGKTYLLDIFYSCVEQTKLRMHFHEFMKMVHESLKRLEGKQDPLKLVAQEIVERARVLCFDEFFVTNVVDAMLLGGLLEALFERGICLVTTSNIEPGELYKYGLQRERFLPAIALIKQKLTVMQVDNQTDYRLRKLTPADNYFYPLDEKAQHFMEKQFASFAKGAVKKGLKLEISGRQVSVVAMSDNAIWFDFNVICQVPRSQLDYLEIAKKFKVVFVSGVRRIPPQENDVISLFVSLVDVLYNDHVVLIMSAADKIENIYQEGQLKFEFKRTLSRLIEMQSEEYAARP